MKEAWIKFGCFLTGYRYSLLSNCSEVAKKTVKRYTAALIIMCIIWGLVGYLFANRYLHSSSGASIAASILFIVIIVQIERQIILQTNKNVALQWFRALIAVMMAVIGSIIIDQIIFKDDIELEKEQFINSKVETIYPQRAAIRQNQIDLLKQQLSDKDSQRTLLQQGVERSPTISVTTVEVNPVPVTLSETDSTGKTTSRTSYTTRPTTISSQMPNPNIALLAPLDSQVQSLQRAMLSQSDSLSTLRVSIEKLLKEKTGFLDELNIMFALLGKSVPALCVYLVWFILLLGLELFILMTKRADQPTDYDAMIAHQMDMHMKKLTLLSGSGSPKATESLARLS